ncbi:MAG: GNAT family N-acetyltransferase [Beijerinckiaceae bacterium]
MTVKIRHALPDDRDAIIDLIWQLNRFESPISGDRVKDRQGAMRCLRDNDEAVRNSHGLSIVAVKDTVIVGYLCLAIESIGSFVREDVRRVGFIRELIVNEQHRRAGVGQRLLQDAEDFCNAINIKRMMLGVLAGNEAAQRAYLKFGLRPYALEMIKDID